MSGSEIFLHIGSHCVAVLKPEHSDFSWSLTYTKDWKEKGFALSPTLPLEGNHSGEAVLAFIENLLPEGVALEHLSTLKSISKNNPIGLALAIKNDLAGAIRLSVNETTEPYENSQFRAISDQELIDRLRFPKTNPMSVWDGKPRL